MENKQFDLDQFLLPYKEVLEYSGLHRQNYYKHIINKLVNLNRPIIIVETGTMWTSLQDNMGAFTYIFGDLIKNHTGGKLITIDISEKNINLCKEYTKEFSDVIKYVISDSVEYLASLPTDIVSNIDFLYLDSWDLDMLNPLPSQIHHLRELSAVYHNLSNNMSIAVDDNLMPNCWIEWIFLDEHGDRTESTIIIHSGDNIIGKGTLVDIFLLNNGWNRLPVISNYSLLGYEKQ